MGSATSSADAGMAAIKVMEARSKARIDIKFPLKKNWRGSVLRQKAFENIELVGFGIVVAKGADEPALRVHQID
jgi:hypothetical protein